MMLTTVVTVVIAVIGVVVAERPNIVFIVADDLGWNDVGFRNGDMLTPNIDKMAREGVILDRNYVQPLCSPSRSAFMSGVYPFKSGLQHDVIENAQAVCFPLNYTLLPQELKKLGYATHIVGKWHLGFCDWDCTPTYRGFDSFFGYYNAMEDYYFHNTTGFLDFRNNKEAEWDYQGQYSALVFTEKILEVISAHNKDQPLFLYLPFQNVHAPTEVPKIYEDRFPHVVNAGRRVFSGMVNALDEAIGNVTDALKKKGLYDNTLFLLTADNGGEIFSYGNNWPLRGGKHSLWEGGTRVTAFMSGAGLQRTGYTYDGMIHAVDWMPTLVSAAGGTPVTDRDGIDQWDSIRNGLLSKRTEFIYNLDYLVIPLQGQAGIRMGNYKLLLGYPGQQDGWHRPMNNTEDDIYEQTVYDLDPDKVQLFDVIADPTERHDLSAQLPNVAAKLKSRLLEYRKQMVPANYPKSDPQGNPRKFGNAWTPGWCKL